MKPRTPPQFPGISRTSAPQTLRDLFGAGSTIQATRIDLDELGPDWLNARVQELNQRFGLALRTTDAVFTLLKTRLRFVAGKVEANAELVTRKGMAARLKKLKGHVSGAVDLLAPVRLGTVQRGDFELIQLLFGRRRSSGAREARDPGFGPRDLRALAQRGFARRFLRRNAEQSRSRPRGARRRGLDS